jgi:hypothetical protein
MRALREPLARREDAMSQQVTRPITEPPAPPKRKPWITPGEAIAALLGLAAGSVVDAIVYWALRTWFQPTWYFSFFGVIGAILGIATFTAIKESRKRPP